MESLSAGNYGAAEFVPLVSVILEHQLYLQSQSTLLLANVTKKLEKFSELDVHSLVQEVSNQRRQNIMLKHKLNKAEEDTNACRRVLGQPMKKSNSEGYIPIPASNFTTTIVDEDR